MIIILFVLSATTGFGQHYRQIMRSVDLDSPGNFVLKQMVGPEGDTVSIVDFIIAHVHDHSVPVYKQAFDSLEFVRENGLSDSSARLLLIGDIWKVEGKKGKVYLTEFGLADMGTAAIAIFWVKAKDVFPLMEHYKVQDPERSGEAINVRSFFEKRYFKSDLKEMGPWQE